MDPGAYSVVTSAMLQQRNLEIAANNVANLNTVGYKAEFPIFKVLEKQADPGDSSQLGGNVISQSGWDRTHIDFGAGALKTTKGPLDVAIIGPGFFVLRSPQGNRYTRAGQFGLNNRSEIVSKDGWPLLSRGGAPIQIPGGPGGRGKITISVGGEVIANNQSIARIDIVNFPNLQQLEKRGNAVFAPVNPQQQPTRIQNPRMEQGVLELSNSESVNEMVRLIQTARLYEAYQRIIQSFDEADDRSVNDLGRVQEVQ